MTGALTVKDVAAVLAVSEATVRRLIREGALTHFHAGTRVRVVEAELDAFMAGTKSTQVCGVCRPGAAAAGLKQVAS